VQFVRAPELGVPSAGETKDGELDKTTLPVPVEVVTPVPPLRTGNAVPDKATARVPDDVMGLPVTERNDGTVIPTLVTLPLPDEEAAIVIEPAAFVIVTLDPAVNVVRVNPVPFPISICPFEGMAVSPVPPDPIARVVDRPAAVPEVF
jgi:hypothetical protein